MEPNPYIHKRFEDYMTKVDSGELTRALALSALRDEIAYAEEQENGSREEITN